MAGLRRRLERLERACRAPQGAVDLEALAFLSDEELLELEALVEVEPLPARVGELLARARERRAGGQDPKPPHDSPGAKA